MKTPAELPSPLDLPFLAHITQNPFFNKSGHSDLFDPATGTGSPGSDYAEQDRNRVISEMIPCTSFAAGRNAFVNILRDNPGTPENEERNIDMNTTMKTDASRWPEADVHDPGDNKPRPWLHSDIRGKAYAHNYLAFEKFVEIGILNQTK